MFGKIFCEMDGSVSHEVSHIAALTYAYLIYNADAAGEVRLRLHSFALNLGVEAFDAALRELEQAGLIARYMSSVPIAEFPNGNVVLGRVNAAQIVGYEPPSMIDRLPPSQWGALRDLVFDRDDYTCRYCGERGGDLECDHVIPIAKGGTNEEGNLITACSPCNRSKRDKALDEWSGRRANQNG